MGEAGEEMEQKERVELWKKKKEEEQMQNEQQICSFFQMTMSSLIPSFLLV